MNPTIIFALLIIPSIAVGRDYFTAAVFEHQTLGKDSGLPARDILEKNLKFYSKAAEIAGKNNVDIIVFNEYGLIPNPEKRENDKPYAENIPDPKEITFNPCIEDDGKLFVLSTFSCLARKYGMYVVANFVDMHTCETGCEAHEVTGCETKCSDDGFNIYNTDVAFDRDGILIARYYKRHPYFEELNRPAGPEYITFDTDFGRCGLIVCFDSVFKESYILAKDYDVDHLIFPTYWFDDILPLKAVEWQQAWALSNKVNFLAANAQMAKSGTLGSGIYSKNEGAVVYTFENDGVSKLLIGNLKIKSDVEIPSKRSIIVIKEDEVYFKKEETGDSFPLHCLDKLVGSATNNNEYRCFKSQTENFTLTKLQDPSGRVKSCNNEFCCDLRYSTEDLKEDFYLAAKNGLNTVKNFYFWWEETCLLLRCDPYQDKECYLEPSTSKTIFKSFELSARFSAQRVYPTVVTNNYRLVPTSEWSITSSNDLVTILKFKSKSGNPLTKAVLMGRNYDKDPPFVPYYQNQNIVESFPN